MIAFLKKRNRTLLEMWTGMIFLGIICAIPIIVFSSSRLMYVVSLILGIGLAIASSIHMYKSLDKALDFDEAVAKKKIMFSYYIRYAIIIAAFAIICVTEIFNPLIAFLGYMTLKVGALIQPLTHKIYNKIFHETDPIAQPIEDEPGSCKEEAIEEETDCLQDKTCSE